MNAPQDWVIRNCQFRILALKTDNWSSREQIHSKKDKKENQSFQPRLLTLECWHYSARTHRHLREFLTTSYWVSPSIFLPQFQHKNQHREILLLKMSIKRYKLSKKRCVSQDISFFLRTILHKTKITSYYCEYNYCSNNAFLVTNARNSL